MDTCSTKKVHKFIDYIMLEKLLHYEVSSNTEKKLFQVNLFSIH